MQHKNLIQPLVILIVFLMSWTSVVQAEDSTTDGLAALQQRAEAGEADAQYLLGELYLLGKGVERDTEKAIPWLEKAAHQQNLLAAETLGQIYSSGLGVPANSSKAFSWLQMAADIAAAQGADEECG